MNKEIERKFLVKKDFKSYVKKEYRIAQGYLSSAPERTVRIRITDTCGFLTIKGLSDKSGMERFEWEKQISKVEAEKLLKLCEPGIIEKTRHLIEHDAHIIEVDVFEGANKGLVLAEIELNQINEIITIPNWLGKEVTGDKRYYNSYLSKNPYSNWP